MGREGGKTPPPDFDGSVNNTSTGRKSYAHHITKGELISKANWQAMNCSKQRTSEFNFTTMQRVFVRFWEEIEDTQKKF